MQYHEIPEVPLERLPMGTRAERRAYRTGWEDFFLGADRHRQNPFGAHEWRSWWLEGFQQAEEYNNEQETTDEREL